MTREQKQEVIELLKDKFSQYSNFYITDTESLTVSQVTALRRTCFDKNVEMKVAKNTLIRKALESLDGDKYSGVYDSLHQVTALMFSENPKDPAVIISSFRKEGNKEKPTLKAAFLNGEVYVGDDQLAALTRIKTKEELIGDVIGLLMSPVQRVIGALLNKPEEGSAKEETPAAEGPATEAPKKEAPTTEASAAEVPAAEAPAAEAPAAEAPKAETPKAEAPAAEAPVAETPKAEEAAAPETQSEEKSAEQPSTSSDDTPEGEK